MTTNNILDIGLSGVTGTGNFVGANTPTLITPNIGVTTATSIVFSPTTSGIIGTTTNDNAAAGKVGEIISSQITFGSPVNIPSNFTPTTLTSILLTAGDWDVFADAGASATTIVLMYASISTANNTMADNSLAAFQRGVATATAQIITVPSQRMSLSTSTTVYLVVQPQFTGTCNAYGYLFARRIR